MEPPPQPPPPVEVPAKKKSSRMTTTKTERETLNSYLEKGFRAPLSSQDIEQLEADPALERRGAALRRRSMHRRNG